jgi:hypothetical protein
MGTLTSITSATAMWVTLGFAQTRQITLVKGSPTNYGTNGFDITWVDNSTQKYYLADRTNNAIDLVDTATNTFLGLSGKANTRGPNPVPGSPRICGIAPGRTAWSPMTWATCGRATERQHH